MSRLSIGDVARQAGIQASTIRYYEQVGLLPEPERDAGRRRYTRDIFPRLALIQAAKESGFTIREIHRLLNGFPEPTPARDRWRSLGVEKMDEIGQQIEELQRVRERLGQLIDCQCAELSDCAQQFAGLDH